MRKIEDIFSLLVFGLLIIVLSPIFVVQVIACVIYEISTGKSYTTKVYYYEPIGVTTPDILTGTKGCKPTKKGGD